MREGWRQQLGLIRGSGYDAADGGRLNKNWRATNEAADITDRYSRDTLRARARDLERNSTLQTASSRLSRGTWSATASPCRPRPATTTSTTKSKPSGGAGHGAQIATSPSSRVSTSFCAWQSFGKGRRRHSFQKCYTPGGLLPFKLQALEVDELSRSVASPRYKGDRVIGGIEYNEYNRPVGYWIEQYNIDGWETNQPVFYPAKDIIFYYSKSRPSQLREVSDLAPSLSRIRDANEFIAAVSMKERIAACFALLIKRAVPTGGFQGGSRNNTDKDRTPYSGKMLTPGLISEMNAGDDAVTINPGNGSSEATGFLKLLQRLVGAGQGLSYESTSRDMSETNYSSARQGMIEDDLTYTEEVELLQGKFMVEVYETFLISAVLAGKLTIPDFWNDPQKYMEHEWVASPKKWIDPQKEANANKTALESCVKSFKQIGAEQGRDWKEQIDDMADVVAYAKEKGVQIGGYKSVQNEPQTDPKENPDE